MSRRTAAAALVSVVALALTSLTVPVAGPLAAPAAAAVNADVPVLVWASCGTGFGRAECTTAEVPLDHDDPTGATIRLALLRMPATAPDPAGPIGTLFVNPGGPGAPARDFALVFERFVPPEISQKFDIVGVDPRGIGGSPRMNCRTDQKRPRQPFEFFPVTPGEVTRRIARDNWERRACRTEPFAIVDHMTTADNAHDMELLRQAVGDELLHYYGISYGTQLGTTYAALYPGNVGSMILDGVLDPRAWSGTPATAGRPFSERINSGYGAWRSLTSAFAECDRVGRKRCAIAGDAAGVWHDIIRRVRKGRDKRTGLSYADVVGITLGYLYDASDIRGLMRDLKGVHRDMFGHRRLRGRTWPPQAPRVGDGVIPGPYSALSRLTGTARGFGQVSDAEAGVMCADSLNPANERRWVQSAKRADRKGRWFGAYWSWVSGICAGWPGATKADRFTGSYVVSSGLAPVLVVGNTYDPATPIHGARAVHGLLAGSSLLRMDGWGHGAIGTGLCIGRAYADYLVRDTLPEAGTVCKMPRTQLFPKRR